MVRESFGGFGLHNNCRLLMSRCYFECHASWKKIYIFKNRNIFFKNRNYEHLSIQRSWINIPKS